MAKQKSKKYPQEHLCVMLETIFEGDECTGMIIRNPALSPEKITSLGIKVQRFAYLLQRQEELRKDQEVVNKSIGVLMYGDRS